MTRIPYRRCAGIIIAVLMATPSLLPPPVSAGSLLGHSVSDFFAGTADNTTALPYGLILGTKGTGPYNWTPLGNLSPQAQWQPGFFHDAASGKYILVGMDGYQYYSGVWTYDAGTDLWAKVADKDVPSSSETFGGNAYDAASGKVLVLPYWNASTVRFYDVATCTWTSQTPSTVPPFTEHFSLALDPARGEFVRFGGDWGYMGGYNNETWTYNLTTNEWTNRTTAKAPPARSYASMVYDRAGKVMVLFGGNSTPTGGGYNQTLHGDTWTYDPAANKWTNMSPAASPPARELTAMVYDGGRGDTVLYGGIVGAQFAMANDTWSYNLSQNTWTNITPPVAAPPRCGHSLACDPAGNKILLVGGTAPTTYNWRADSWTYDRAAGSWTMGTLHAPSARYGQLVAYDSDAGEIVLYGGDDGRRTFIYPYTNCGDTWKYNLSQGRWTLMSPTKACQRTAPLSGYRFGPGALMAYDERRREMLAFNPEDLATPETYSYNLSTNTWKALKPFDSLPDALASALTYNGRTGQFVLYQGGSLSTYNWSANTWSTDYYMSGPTEMASVVYIGSTGELLLQDEKGATWLFNFTRDEWTKLDLALTPGERWSFSMAYDAYRDEVVLYGGSRMGWKANDTWCFDVRSMAWRKVDTARPMPGSSMHDLVYLGAEKEILLLGGSDESYIKSDGMWIFNRLRFNASGSYTSNPVDTNGTAFFGNFSWDASVPAGTGLRLQLRSGPDLPTLNGTAFTGPDGTAATYYSSSGQELSTVHDGGRLFQYRAFLNTSSELVGPVLRGVKVSYNLQQAVSVTSPREGDALTGIKPIKWNASDPDRDNLTFDIYLLDSGNGSFQLASNLSNSTRNFQWDTTTNRSGSYRIMIVARDDNRTIPVEAYNLSGVFRLAHPNHLPEVVLHRPVYGETVNSSSVTFEWSGGDADGDALTYHVYLGFEEFVIDNLPDEVAVTGETCATISNLTNGTMYFWSVLANDGTDNGTLPEASMFRVNVPPPPPVNHPPEVTLLSPADGANVTNASVTLGWSGQDQDGDRLTYRVFLAGSGFNLSTLPAPFSTTSETSVEAGNLSDGATYYWTVIANDGREDGTAITVWRFTVRLADPAGSPRIVEHSPAGPRTPLNPAIVVGFDREMSTQSVFAAISISPPVEFVGVLASNNSTVFKFTFTLGAPLATDTRYTVNVDTTARSSRGVPMFRPFNWTFTTLAPGEVDSELPTVLVTDPADGAAGVDRLENVTVMFSEAMSLDATRAACSVSPAVNGSWEWLNNRGFAIRFRPANGFANGTYRVTVSHAAADGSGNPLDGNGNGRADGPADNFTFSFRVGAPMVGSPRLLARSLEGREVRPGSPLVLTFDRRMDQDSVRGAFRITPAVEGVWGADAESKVFTFTPSKRLRDGTTYTVTLGAGAQDAEGNHFEQVTWTFTTAAATRQPGAGYDLVLLLGLLAVAAVAAAAFAIARRRRAAPSSRSGPGAPSAPKGFAIDDIFLMYNDGRLIQHTTRRIRADMDVDIFTSMLTALQAFVKDSMGHDGGGELGSMEFGGSKILLEKGRFVIVAVVITGGEPSDLRDEMKAAVRNIESEFGEVLKDWEGGASQLSGTRRFLSELGDYRVDEEAEPGKPRLAVALKSEVEFYQGFVRLKVAIKNDMPTFIMNATFELIFNEEALKLYSIEPSYERKGDKVMLGNIEPREKKTVAFFLDPQICTESYLEGMLTFKDAHGTLESVKMARKLTSVVCPILFTDENINTAMLKRMVAEQLDKRDSKVFTIPAHMTAHGAFEIGKAAVQHHDIRIVREFREDKPFRAEAWYYGKAKGRPDRLVVQVRVIPEMSFLEFSVSSDSVLMLTGMLAELKTDLNKELETHKQKGAMKQVTDRDDIDAVAEIRSLLEKSKDAEGG